MRNYPLVLTTRVPKLNLASVAPNASATAERRCSSQCGDAARHLLQGRRYRARGRVAPGSHSRAKYRPRLARLLQTKRQSSIPCAALRSERASSCGPGDEPRFVVARPSLPLSSLKRGVHCHGAALDPDRSHHRTKAPLRARRPRRHHQLAWLEDHVHRELPSRVSRCVAAPVIGQAHRRSRPCRPDHRTNERPAAHTSCAPTSLCATWSTS